jgi:hypothetical protein
VTVPRQLEAREAAWPYVGPETIVVGNSAHNDLTAMRWIHPVIVDTWQLESARADIYRGDMENVPPVAVLGGGRERPPSLSFSSGWGEKSSPIRRGAMIV